MYALHPCNFYQMNSIRYFYFKHDKHNQRLHESRPIGPALQASYMIALGTTILENQPAAKIAARPNIIRQMAPYMS